MATKKTAKKRTPPPAGKAEAVVIEGVAEKVAATSTKEKSSPSSASTASSTAPKPKSRRVGNIAIAAAFILGAAGMALGGYSYLQMRDLAASEIRTAEINAHIQEIAQTNMQALSKLNAELADLREMQTKLAQEIAALQEMPQADDRISGLVLNLNELEAKLEAIASDPAPAAKVEVSAAAFASLNQEVAALREMIMAAPAADDDVADPATNIDQPPSQDSDDASWWDKLMGAISFTRLDGDS